MEQTLMNQEGVQVVSTPLQKACEKASRLVNPRSADGLFVRTEDYACDTLRDVIINLKDEDVVSFCFAEMLSNLNHLMRLAVAVADHCALEIDRHDSKGDSFVRAVESVNILVTQYTKTLTLYGRVRKVIPAEVSSTLEALETVTKKLRLHGTEAGSL